MTLGDIFDRTFRLLGRTIGRSAIIALILLAPTALLFSFSLGSFFESIAGLVPGSYDHMAPEMDQLAGMFGAIGLITVTGILFGLANLAAYLAITHLACGEFEGKPVTWEEAFRKGVGLPLLRGVGVSVLISLAFGAILIVPYMLIIAGAASDSSGLAGIGIFLLLAAFGIVLFLAFRWNFVLQTIAWEDTRVMDSFRRSWDLVEGNWWRVFGIMILFGLLVDFAISLLLTPLTLIVLWDFFAEYFKLLGGLAAGDSDPQGFLEVLRSLGPSMGILIAADAILTALVAPLYSVALFFDLRARKGEFSQTTGTTQGPAPIPPAPMV
jgi:hypothetical protein